MIMTPPHVARRCPLPLPSLHAARHQPRTAKSTITARLCCANAVPADVDHIIHSPRDPVVAAGRGVEWHPALMHCSRMSSARPGIQKKLREENQIERWVAWLHNEQRLSSTCPAVYAGRLGRSAAYTCHVCSSRTAVRGSTPAPACTGMKGAAGHGHNDTCWMDACMHAWAVRLKRTRPRRGARHPQ